MAPYQKKELRQARKRKEIEDAAEKLFREKGFEQTTMDDIADRALCSKTTIYNYFNRKEDLYLIMAIRAYQKLTQMFNDALDPNAKGIEQVKTMGKEFYKFAMNYPTFRQAFDLSGTEEIFDLSALNDKSEAKRQISQSIIADLQKEQQEFVALWTEMCARGQADGSLTSEYPPMVIAFTLGTMTTGLVDEIMQRESVAASLNLSSKKIFDIALGFLENGIGQK